MVTVRPVRPVRAADTAAADALSKITIADLLLHLPRSYDDLTNVRPMDKIEAGVLQTLQGEVVEIEEENWYFKLSDHTDWLKSFLEGHSDIIIPARLSLGVFHQLSDRLDLMFDYTFIQSSAVKSIRVDILDEPAPNGVDKVSQAHGLILANWRDSFTAAIGMNYRWNDKLTLRTGYKFDLTPIRSPEYRHPSAPDSNRHMFSIGANYKLRKHMSVDLAYSLIMLEDAESRYRDPCRGAFLEDEDGFTSDKPQDCTGNAGTFRGKFHDTFINTIGVQLNTRM